MFLSEILRDVKDIPCDGCVIAGHVGLCRLLSILVESITEANRPSFTSLCNKNPTRILTFYHDQSQQQAHSEETESNQKIKIICSMLSMQTELYPPVTLYILYKRRKIYF
jgi:hypothetical protein